MTPYRYETAYELAVRNWLYDNNAQRIRVDGPYEGGDFIYEHFSVEGKLLILAYRVTKTERGAWFEVLIPACDSLDNLTIPRAMRMCSHWTKLLGSQI